MRRVGLYSHRFGLEAVTSAGLMDAVDRCLEEPLLAVESGAAAKINAHVRDRLSAAGWALEPKVHPAYKLTINAMKERVGLTVQTGNITRAFYDLMKFQALHANNRIDAAVLVLPSGEAASVLGSNIASFTRVTNELDLFKHVVTVPCLVLSIDN